MDYIGSTLANLLQQTAFLNLTFGNFIMILVAFVFLYLAIRKGFEPLLLVPIAFGMLLVNIYPDIMAAPEDMSNGVGGLLHYFFILDEWSILPSLIFMGVGAMTDFGPLIANPKSFLLGAAAQFGIFAAYLGAMLLGFSDKAAAAVSGDQYMDFMDLCVSKGDALKKVQKIYGIDRSECMAFGDNYNDCEMLKQAEFSYAMASAADDIKKNALYVTDSVEKILRGELL